MFDSDVFILCSSPAGWRPGMNVSKTNSFGLGVGVGSLDREKDPGGNKNIILGGVQMATQGITYQSHLLPRIPWASFLASLSSATVLSYPSDWMITSDCVSLIGCVLLELDTKPHPSKLQHRKWFPIHAMQYIVLRLFHF